ncbi:MAG: hypothetical protein EOM24_27825 [Chloroflexia bacterium]|nr:hypothetical protein [Chloroflexia bacterium]
MLVTNRLLELSADTLIAASHAYTAAVDAQTDVALTRRCLAALEQAQRMHRTIIQLVEENWGGGQETTQQMDEIAMQIGYGMEIKDGQDIVDLWSELVKYQNEWNLIAQAQRNHAQQLRGQA